MSSVAKAGMGLWLAGVILSLSGLGCLASPFYLPGGVVGVLNGDRPMNQMGDKYLLHMAHSFGSLILGAGLCAGGLVVKGMGMGAGIAAAAYAAGKASQPTPVSQSPADKTPPPQNHLPPGSS